MSYNTDDLPVNDIGADVAKATFVAAVDVAGMDLHKLPHKNFARTRQGSEKFLAWCRKRVGENVRLRIIMEATGLYSEQLADWLLELDPQCIVVIANARSVSDFTKSHTDTKTDTSDARSLARYGHGRKLHPYVPLPAAQKILRLLVRERRRVVDLIQAERLRRNEYKDICEEITEMHQERIDQLTEQKKQLEKKIREHVSKEEELSSVIDIYKQVCGIGTIVAAVLQAELGDLKRFKSLRDLVTFAGLKPRQTQSGTSVRKRTRMSKRGSSHARAMLYLAAMAAIGQQNRFARHYQQLVARGKNGKVALGAVMRKMLVVLRALVTGDGSYNDAHKPPCGKTTNTCGKAVNACGQPVIA